MSYDLSIWTTKALTDSEELAVKYDLIREQGGYRYEGNSWQISFTDSLMVEDDDIPEEAQSQLAGIKYQIQFSLEPISAPKTAHQLLDRITKGIAKTYRGIIENPQEDCFALPSGVKKQIPVVKDKIVSEVELTWFYNHDKLEQVSEIHELLRILATYLPEALPKRYGLYEPPQHKYKDSDHLTTFLHDNRYDIVVWYPSSPVTYVSSSLIEPQNHWRKLDQFYCNRFSISFLHSILAEEEWQLQFKRLWRRMTEFFDPFYGEVRRLDGRTYSRGRTGYTMQSQQNPTPAGFWKGIPKQLGTAIVLSEQYFESWPKVARNDLYVANGGFHYLSLPDWTDLRDLSKYVGKAPRAIRQVKEPKLGKQFGGYTYIYNDKYPKLFPFSD